MKTKIYLSAIVLFFMYSVFYSQSDYKRTQEFKSQHKQIEDAIRNAASVDECEDIVYEIERFRNDFINSKPLLDKALYPDDFESAIAKIENSLKTRQRDFIQITDLTTQVETLQAHVSDLNLRNEELLKQINELNLKTAKNETEISKLNRLVAQLKDNIRQRDLLVRDLVDSLLVEFIKSPGDMSQAEKQSIVSQVKRSNLFYNIERTIADNIQFVKVTFMTPQDFSDIKTQYREFNKVWTQIGPKLAGVYLNKKENKSEIASIDSLFSEWDRQIDNEMWANLNSHFTERGINLTPFNSNDQFVSSINSFIDDEITNLGTKSKEESENTFKTFADDIYFKTIQPEWIPVLIENNMMTKADQESMEAKIAIWKEEVVPSSPILFYIAIGIIIIGTLTYVIMKAKMKSVKMAYNSKN